MSMYTLKSIARKGGLLSVTAGLLVATVIPAASAFADALNPLTERSLLLSSSAPGYIDTDGSGNSAGSPNSVGQNYAPAGSGPNGKKTGQTFSFKTSTSGVIKGITFQYCTTAAGKCAAPGNNTGDADPNKDGSIADSTRQLNETADTGGWATQKSDLNVSPGFAEGPGAGQFQVTYGASDVQADWGFATSNKETADHTQPKTGKNNFITLANASATDVVPAGTKITITFKASESVFITNPGADAFFVKLNTYSSENTANHVPGNEYNIDGGVTVANVMTDSIHITTKVLETMAFSVGTRNKDTVTLNCAGYVNEATTPALHAAGCEDDDSGTVPHGTCDPVQNVNNNRLNLGDPDAEYSLETGKAWSVYSYWRLSSNSSGGATVYYSGDTLANTVGDKITDMPTETNSSPGTEQFGLGFVAPEAGSAEYIAEHPTRAIDSYPFRTLSTQTSGRFLLASLPVQPYTADYDEATGVNGTDNEGTVSPSAKFKFVKESLTNPEPIAQQNDQVISCATAKMRYVGNIAADTPAGVYTTKINYLAAPQY